MKAVVVAQTDRGEKHIQGDPDIHHPHIEIKLFLMDQNITDQIYNQGRYAEIYQKRRRTGGKKEHHAQNNKNDNGIDRICNFFQI